MAFLAQNTTGTEWVPLILAGIAAGWVGVALGWLALPWRPTRPIAPWLLIAALVLSALCSGPLLVPMLHRPTLWRAEIFAFLAIAVLPAALAVVGLGLLRHWGPTPEPDPPPASKD